MTDNTENKGTAKATNHEIVLPEIGNTEAEASNTEAEASTDTETSVGAAVYAKFKQDRDIMFAKAKDRGLMSQKEKQLGVDNLKIFLLNFLTFVSSGKNALEDGSISTADILTVLTQTMIQMPSIKSIKFGQLYPEFKDLDEAEINEIVEYLRIKGGVQGLDQTGFLLLAEASFKAIGYVKIAVDAYVEAFKKGK